MLIEYFPCTKHNHPVILCKSIQPLKQKFSMLRVWLIQISITFNKVVIVDGFSLGQHYVNAKSHLYGRLVCVEEGSGTGLVLCKCGDILRWPLSQMVHISIFDKDYFVLPDMSYNHNQPNTAVTAYLLMRRLSARSQIILTNRAFLQPRLFLSNFVIDSYPVGACEYSGHDWVSYLDHTEYQKIYRCDNPKEAIEHLWTARHNIENTSSKRKSS